MKKTIILNCPPRSGKDTIAEMFVERNDFKMLSFKGKLVEVALTISNVSKNEWDERYKEQKEEPWDKLGGISQRNYLIMISEEWIKPVHGKSYFGDIIAQTVSRDNENNNFILPDGGFEEEIHPIFNELGQKVLIIQWDREGCTFDYDSRDWITTFPEITFRTKPNNGTIEEHYENVKRLITDYYGEEI